MICIFKGGKKPIKEKKEIGKRKTNQPEGKCSAIRENQSYHSPMRLIPHVVKNKKDLGKSGAY